MVYSNRYLPIYSQVFLVQTSEELIMTDEYLEQLECGGVNPNTKSLIIYTSGTTGRPKVCQTFFLSNVTLNQYVGIFCLILKGTTPLDQCEELVVVSIVKESARILMFSPVEVTQILAISGCLITYLVVE